MPKTKVLLIEDNRLLREGIAAVLDAHGDFELIALAEDGDAFDELQRSGQTPDVVLLDLGLARTSSLQLMKRLHAEQPEVRVVAMDILPEKADLVEFIEAGGSGFILKTAGLQDYVETIKAVARGQKVLPSILTASLFTQIVESALESDAGIPEDALRLTAREKEIVELISEGLSNKEISARLHIATHTVKSHVHNILEKLALSSRLQIAAFTRQRDPQ